MHGVQNTLLEQLAVYQEAVALLALKMPQSSVQVLEMSQILLRLFDLGAMTAKAQRQASQFHF